MAYSTPKHLNYVPNHIIDRWESIMEEYDLYWIPDDYELDDPSKDAWSKNNLHSYYPLVGYRGYFVGMIVEEFKDFFNSYKNPSNTAFNILSGRDNRLTSESQNKLDKIADKCVQRRKEVKTEFYNWLEQTGWLKELQNLKTVVDNESFDITVSVNDEDEVYTVNAIEEALDSLSYKQKKKIMQGLKTVFEKKFKPSKELSRNERKQFNIFDEEHRTTRNGTLFESWYQLEEALRLEEIFDSFKNEENDWNEFTEEFTERAGA